MLLELQGFGVAKPNDCRGLNGDIKFRCNSKPIMRKGKLVTRYYGVGLERRLHPDQLTTLYEERNSVAALQRRNIKHGGIV